MECFAHEGKSAAGLCKSCGKAVCRSCALDQGFAIACSESCAREASALHEMNQRGKKLYGIDAKRSRLPSGVIMWLLFGLTFCGLGAFASWRSGEPEWFLLVFGTACFVVAAIAYRRAREIGIQC